MGLLEQAESAQKAGRKRNIAGLLLLIIGVICLIAGIFLKHDIPFIPGSRNTVLVFSHWRLDPAMEELLKSLIAEFEEDNPGIKIRPQVFTYSDYAREILSPSGGEEEGGKTDILLLDSRWSAFMIDEDLLLSLEPHREEFLAIREFPADRYTGTEPIYMLPILSFMDVLYYNIDILQAAGFDRPPKNRSAYLACARTLASGDNAPGDRAPLSFSLATDTPHGIYEDIFSWIWASGIRMFSDGKPDFSSRSMAEVFSFFSQLGEAGLFPRRGFSQTPENKIEEFVSGRAAMIIGPAAALSRIRGGNPGLNFGITTIPAPDNHSGRPAFGVGDWYAAVSRESGHPEEALRFITFLMKKSPALAKASGAFPVNITDTLEFSGMDPLYEKAAEIYQSGDAVRELEGLPHLDEFEALLRDEVILVLNGLRSPQESIRSIQEQADGFFGAG